jgi:hypothetical protein
MKESRIQVKANLRLFTSAFTCFHIFFMQILTAAKKETVEQEKEMERKKKEFEEKEKRLRDKLIHVRFYHFNLLF